ncbi:MAG: hypothetical protein ACI8YQ_001030 [Polaribacter sp.]
MRFRCAVAVTKKIKNMKLLITFLTTIFLFTAQPPTLKMGLLKYNGGGDWYSNPTALPNLAEFCNKELGTNFNIDFATVEVGSADLFNYSFIHMTGHGNVVFSEVEAENLRNYLIAGGFLHIDDNYGMDPYVRAAMKMVFPESQFIELPFGHDIYKQKFAFQNGLPKVHKHDDKPAQGFGIFHEDRLVCFYSYECDLGDGWEDQEVHKDDESVRQQALKMGANIVQFHFGQ